MATGLILVDIQNEYFPGGRMELAGIDRAAANAKEVLTLFREKGWPMFHVQHLRLKPMLLCSRQIRPMSTCTTASAHYLASG